MDPKAMLLSCCVAVVSAALRTPPCIAGEEQPIVAIEKQGGNVVLDEDALRSSERP